MHKLKNQKIAFLTIFNCSNFYTFNPVFEYKTRARERAKASERANQKENKIDNKIILRMYIVGGKDFSF